VWREKESEGETLSCAQSFCSRGTDGAWLGVEGRGLRVEG
jgi:hypothetical protein